MTRAIKTTAAAIPAIIDFSGDPDVDPCAARVEIECRSITFARTLRYSGKGALYLKMKTFASK
jgi:hypothetical protein